MLVSHSTTILRVSTESEAVTCSRPARAMFPSVLRNRLAPMVAGDATGTRTHSLWAVAGRASILLVIYMRRVELRHVDSYHFGEGEVLRAWQCFSECISQHNVGGDVFDSDPLGLD